jgi:hypothetical protein
MVTIACAVFFLAGVDGGNFIHIFDWIPDVASMTSKSEFPLATAMAYGIALMAAPVVTIIACFARIGDIRPLRDFWRSRSSIACLFWGACYVFVVSAPYVFVGEASSYSWASHFFRAVRSNQLMLLLWAEGVFLVNCLFMCILMMGLRVFLIV